MYINSLIYALLTPLKSNTLFHEIPINDSRTPLPTDAEKPHFVHASFAVATALRARPASKPEFRKYPGVLCLDSIPLRLQQVQ